jgi:hypothetical protein
MTVREVVCPFSQKIQDTRYEIDARLNFWFVNQTTQRMKNQKSPTDRKFRIFYLDHGSASYKTHNINVSRSGNDTGTGTSFHSTYQYIQTEKHVPMAQLVVVAIYHDVGLFTRPS